MAIPTLDPLWDEEDDDDEEDDQSLLAAPEQRICRLCGCTDSAACIGRDGQPCHWVEDDLCSACMEA